MSVLRGPLHRINHEIFTRSFLCHELQPKLLFKHREDGRTGGNIGLWRWRWQTGGKFAGCCVVVRESNAVTKHAGDSGPVEDMLTHHYGQRPREVAQRLTGSVNRPIGQHVARVGEADTL